MEWSGQRGWESGKRGMNWQGGERRERKSKEMRVKKREEMKSKEGKN